MTYLGALEAYLGHTDIIRISWHMQWNMEVLNTPNYSLGRAYMNILELGHANLPISVG